MICAHAPHKTSQFPGYCCYSRVALFASKHHLVIFPAQTFIDLVSVCDHGRIISFLPRHKILRLIARAAFADALSRLDQNRPGMLVSRLRY